MNRELARRAEELFLELAALPPEARGARLDQGCNGDAALKYEVQSLLDMHEEDTDFLEPRHLAPAEKPDAQLPANTRIGAYTILGVLGAGGMGVVYTAEQERPRRTVALKLIRRGLATASMLRRFEREADVLGRLQHPGIAQIYEAGVADAGDGPQPFIAMELVRGLPLTKHADANNLGTRQRLELFAKVCDAVQHAHQRGVIHRDLKPANILVTDAATDPTPAPDATTPPSHTDPGGQPKVLDFGVARAADADIHATTMRTSIGQIIGTLAYMSPEGVTGDPAEVDTRSDVYSLGVILYQLLTGRLPHDLSGRSVPEALRVIREDEPQRLSSTNRIFRGDLETIVSKAIDKDRARRYQSAADLADDLRRFLRGEAVLARQNSSFYLLRKQMARYRWVFRAAVVAIAALLTFAVYAAWQARVQALSADREREARYEADVARYRADNQRAQAEEARARADALGAQLAVELSRARIELGRLEGNLRRMSLAEQSLWAEHLTSPASPAAFWALWELYDRFPCRWTRRIATLPRAGAVSSDGAYFAVGAHTGEVVVVNTRTGEEVARAAGLGAPVLSVAVTRESAFAGLQNGSIVRIPVRADPEPLVLTVGSGVHADGVRSLALSSDGSCLASGGGDGAIHLWDLSSGQLTLSWRAHDDAVVALKFTAPGDQLFSAPRVADEQTPLRVWDRHSGQKLRDLVIPQPASPATLAVLDAPGRLLVGDHARRVFAIDLTTGEVTIPIAAARGPVINISPSPDGARVLVTASGASFILDAASLSTIFEQGSQRQTVLAAGWADDASFVLLCYDGLARGLLAKPSPSTQLARISPQWCFGIDIDPRGGLIAATSSDGSLHIIDASTLAPRLVLPLDPGHRARVVKFIPASDEDPTRPERLVVGNALGRIRVLDADSGVELSTMAATPSEIYSLEVHPDGRRVAAGYGDGRLCIWNLQTGAVELELPRQPRRVEGLAFSSDGRLLVASGHPSALTVWDTQSGAPLASLPTSAMPWGLAFTPDGRSLLVSLFDGAVDVFDFGSGRLLQTVQAHQRLVPALAISPDGALFATGSEDGSLKLWDTATRTRLVSFELGAGEIVTATFSSDSRTLVATSGSGLVVRIDLGSSEPFIRANEPYGRELARLAPSIQPEPPALP